MSIEASKESADITFDNDNVDLLLKPGDVKRPAVIVTDVFAAHGKGKTRDQINESEPNDKSSEPSAKNITWKGRINKENNNAYDFSSAHVLDTLKELKDMMMAEKSNAPTKTRFHLLPAGNTTEKEDQHDATLEQADSIIDKVEKANGYGEESEYTEKHPEDAKYIAKAQEILDEMNKKESKYSNRTKIQSDGTSSVTPETESKPTDLTHKKAISEFIGETFGIDDKPKKPTADDRKNTTVLESRGAKNDSAILESRKQTDGSNKTAIFDNIKNQLEILKSMNAQNTNQTRNATAKATEKIIEKEKIGSQENKPNTLEGNAIQNVDWKVKNSTLVGGRDFGDNETKTENDKFKKNSTENANDKTQSVNINTTPSVDNTKESVTNTSTKSKSEIDDTKSLKDINKKEKADLSENRNEKSTSSLTDANIFARDGESKSLSSITDEAKEQNRQEKQMDLISASEDNTKHEPDSDHNKAHSSPETVTKENSTALTPTVKTNKYSKLNETIYEIEAALKNENLQETDAANEAKVDANSETFNVTENDVQINNDKKATDGQIRPNDKKETDSKSELLHVIEKDENKDTQSNGDERTTDGQNRSNEKNSKDSDSKVAASDIVQHDSSMSDSSEKKSAENNTSLPAYSEERTKLNALLHNVTGDDSTEQQTIDKDLEQVQKASDILYHELSDLDNKTMSMEEKVNSEKYKALFFQKLQKFISKLVPLQLNMKKMPSWLTLVVTLTDCGCKAYSALRLFKRQYLQNYTIFRGLNRVFLNLHRNLYQIDCFFCLAITELSRI